MSLAPIRTDDTASRVNLVFRNNETDLRNVDMQAFMNTVTHRVQTTMSILRPYVTWTEINGTFQWRNLTEKRDPAQRTHANPMINPTKQSFSQYGITIHAYDMDTWLVDYMVKNATINFPATVMETMMYGYERLADRCALAAMLTDVRTRETGGGNAPNEDWKLGKVETDTSSLADSRIGAATTGAAASQTLAVPAFQTLQKIKRKFRDANVPYNTPIYALLTPGMEEIIERMVQFQNKDYIWNAAKGREKDGVIYFYGVNWIKCTPEIAPGGFYADKFISADTGGAANKVSPLQDAQANNANNAIDLTPNNHEVIPFWTKDNIKVGYNGGLSWTSIYKVPTYRNTPIISRTEWCGGAREQDVKQFNLVIPTSF